MTQPKLKIKKGDRVVVLTGRDKGKRGEVLQVIPVENRAVVQGINVVRRHRSSPLSKRAASSPKRRQIHSFEHCGGGPLRWVPVPGGL